MSLSIKRHVGIPCLLAVLMLSTSGCSLKLTKLRAYSECTNGRAGGGECKTGAEAVWERDPGGGKKGFGSILTFAAQTMGALPDAAGFELDTAGSTIPYPAAGSFVVSLTDTSTGQVQAARSFPWIRIGTVIRAQNADAVNDWAYANAGTADKISYDVVPFRSNYGGGAQGIAGSAKYEGSVQATSSVHFDGGPECQRRPNSPHLCRD